MKRCNSVFVHCIAKIKAFPAKLGLWKGNIESDSLSMSSTLIEQLHQNPDCKDENLMKSVTEHLMKLEEVDVHFPSLDDLVLLRIN